MKTQVMILAGTKRGLFTLTSDKSRKKWSVQGPFLKGWDISHAILDTRGKTPRMLAAGRSPAFGAVVSISDTLGKKWERVEHGPTLSEYPADKVKEWEKWGISTQRKVWHLEPGHASEPGVMYAGVAPAALFRSEDGGKHWKEVASLTNHPSRKDWSPGAGGLCLHSIQVDPFDANTMYLGISAAGVFKTQDGGKSWTRINKGLKNPKKGLEGVTSCVHKLLVHPTRAGRLYQQNHGGVFRSDDHGEQWHRIDSGLPSEFGFPLGLHPKDPETCYVIPLMPEEGTFRATNGSLNVYQAKKGGRSWNKLSRGLPQQHAYVNVLREGMATDALDPLGVYFGTGNGQLYFSRDEGARWEAMASHFPAILSVSAATLN